MMFSAVKKKRQIICVISMDSKFYETEKIIILKLQYQLLIFVLLIY